MKIVYETKQYPKQWEPFYHEIVEAVPCCEGMTEAEPRKLFCNDRQSDKADLELGVKEYLGEDYELHDFSHCPWCGKKIELVQSRIIKMKAVETERTYKERHTEYVEEK